MSATGLLIVYTGDGKGKTTAALGLALRSLAYGKKVALVQFVKSPAASGEVRLFRRLKLPLRVHASGLGFVGLGRDPYTRKQHAAAAVNGLAVARRWLKTSDVIILDEINGALHAKLLSLRAVLALLRSRPPSTTVVLTGRQAPVVIRRLADLVTEMRSVKHPFTRGLAAQAGIDY